MIVEPETGAFKIRVAIGINSMLLGYDTLEVYDSRTNPGLSRTWFQKGTVNSTFNSTYNSTFFDGSVYFSCT